MGSGSRAVLGVSGFKNSGKTTLIEGLVGYLRAEGYRVGVIKHQGESALTDRPGSDTYRFYQAGADVLGYDGQSVFLKRRLGESLSLETALDSLGGGYDVVLVEGFKRAKMDKLWLLQAGQAGVATDDIMGIIGVLSWHDDVGERLAEAISMVRRWLAIPGAGESGVR